MHLWVGLETDNDKLYKVNLDIGADNTEQFRVIKEWLENIGRISYEMWVAQRK